MNVKDTLDRLYRRRGELIYLRSSTRRNPSQRAWAQRRLNEVDDEIERIEELKFAAYPWAVGE